MRTFKPTIDEVKNLISHLFEFSYSNEQLFNLKIAPERLVDDIEAIYRDYYYPDEPTTKEEWAHYDNLLDDFYQKALPFVSEYAAYHLQMRNDNKGIC